MQKSTSRFKSLHKKCCHVLYDHRKALTPLVVHCLPHGWRDTRPHFCQSDLNLQKVVVVVVVVPPPPPHSDSVYEMFCHYNLCWSTVQQEVRVFTEPYHNHITI